MPFGQLFVCLPYQRIFLQTVSLPYKCPLPLVQRPELLKAFCIWGRLKLSFSHSAIHNIRERKKELARMLNMSENTFRKFLKIMKAEGMCWEDETGILRLANKYVIYKVTGIEPNISERTGLILDKRFQLTINQLHPRNIKSIVVQMQRAQINHVNLNRVIDLVTEADGKIHSPKALNKVREEKKEEAERLIERAKKYPAVGYRTNSRIGFVDDNVSSQTIAGLFGLKSKMSGNRFMHSLRKDGVISYRKRSIRIDELREYTDMKMFQESQTLPVTIIKRKGEYYLGLRIPNSWKITPRTQVFSSKYPELTAWTVI